MKVGKKMDKMYYIRRNNNLVIDTPWYAEAVREYNNTIDNGKKGDLITLSVELEPPTPDYDVPYFKLLAAMRL